jgi:hypothetical protein
VARYLRIRQRDDPLAIVAFSAGISEQFSERPSAFDHAASDCVSGISERLGGLGDRHVWHMQASAAVRDAGLC